MPDQQDVVVLGGEPARLVVDLGHQRAGRVDGAQAPVPGFLPDLRRDAVRGEDDHRSLGNRLGLLHEDRAPVLKRPDDMSVMDDLLADVDGRAEALEGLLDGLHRPVDARAVATGLGEEHTARLSWHGPSLDDHQWGRSRHRVTGAVAPGRGRSASRIAESPLPPCAAPGQRE